MKYIFVFCFEEKKVKNGSLQISEINFSSALTYSLPLRHLIFWGHSIVHMTYFSPKMHYNYYSMDITNSETEHPKICEVRKQSFWSESSMFRTEILSAIFQPYFRPKKLMISPWWDISYIFVSGVYSSSGNLFLSTSAINIAAVSHPFSLNIHDRRCRSTK